MTINVLFDPILGKLRQSDIGVVSVASLIVTDPLVVNNLIVNSNTSINTLYGNTINASTISTNRLISNNIANNSTISTNLIFTNGLTASLASTTQLNTSKLLASTATLGLTHISTIDWNLTSGATVTQEGQMNWDANQQTAVIGMAGGNVDLALGMETLFPRRVRNSTGSTMAKGTVVYINGVSGNTPTVERAIATSDMSSAFTLGMTAESIGNNATGWVTTFGELTGLDLSTYTGGDTLYLSGATAGAFTNQVQLAPNHYVRVGTVVKATTDGALVVNVINGYELNELHNVAITSLASGQILQSGASSLWYNRSLASAVADLNVLASLGSLAYLNSVTQEYLPSSASFSNLYVTDIQTGGLAVTSTASVRNLRATNIIAGNASLSGALNVGNIFGLNFLGVASTLIAETGLITNVKSTDISNISNISTNTLYANIISAGTYLNLPSLGSLAVLNDLSFTSLTNQPSLSSLAFQSTIDYSTNQILNKPSLGSLAIISNVESPLVLSGVTLSLSQASIVHNNLGGLTTGDPHTQYALLAGRSGGQVLTGGTNINNILTLKANSAAVNGASADAIIFGVASSGSTSALTLSHNGKLTHNVSHTFVNGYTLNQTITGTVGDSIGAFYNVTDTGGGIKTIYAHRAKLTYSGATIIQGMQSTSNQMAVTGGGVVNFAEILTSNLDVTGSSAIGEARLIRLFTPNVASTASIGTLIGLDIPALTQGTTNWSIYSNGGDMYHAGNIGIGTAPTAFRALNLSDTKNSTLAYMGFFEGATEKWVIGTQSGEFGIYDSASGAFRMTFEPSGEVGVGTTNPTARFDVEQTSTTAAIPTLELTQSDLSEEFINFVSTVGTANSLSTAALGTYFGKARVGFNGVFKWIAIYN